MNHYSLGCAFNTDQILMNFPYSKLKITCKECEVVIGNNHRNLLVKKIFTECLLTIITDIIDNNITFWLPLTGSKKCSIHIQKVQGDEFKNLRKGGKWKDVDILKSLFTGYEIRFFMYGNRTPRVKTVYLNKELRDKITRNTNNCMSYGDSKIDKTIKDYYQDLYNKFPLVPQSDIQKILIFSFKSLYLHNSYGGDTCIFNSSFWCYIGNLRKNSLEHFYYYIKKLTIKLRVLYKRKNIKWDGYYYFALSDQQYSSYLNQKNKRGRPRKYFSFGSICLYQILDECKINEHNKKYIFRVPYLYNFKLKYFIRDYISDNCELIQIREPLKFKDILVSSNQYQIL